MDVVVNPPKPGEPSYELFKKVCINSFQNFRFFSDKGWNKPVRKGKIDFSCIADDCHIHELEILIFPNLPDG